MESRGIFRNRKGKKSPDQKQEQEPAVWKPRQSFLMLVDSRNPYCQDRKRYSIIELNNALNDGWTISAIQALKNGIWAFSLEKDLGRNVR